MTATISLLASVFSLIAHPIFMDPSNLKDAILAAQIEAAQQAQMAPPAAIKTIKISNNKSLYQMISEIASEDGFTYEITDPEDTWNGTLKYLDQTKPIVGFDIGLNSREVKKICNHKSLTAEALKRAGVPCVEHRRFEKGSTEEEQRNVREEIATFWEIHGRDIVCKPDSGTCGNDIYRINSSLESLMEKVESIYGKYNNVVCLSPFYSYTNEVRSIMVDSDARISFLKEPPYVIGNGRDTVQDLIKAKFSKTEFMLKDASSSLLAEVPTQGEKIPVNWKHNLSLGATAHVIDLNKYEKGNAIRELAIKASQAVGIRFASVDMIEVDGPEGLLVLEINNGVMTECLIEQYPDLYGQVKEMIREGLFRLFSRPEHTH